MTPTVTPQESIGGEGGGGALGRSGQKRKRNQRDDEDFLRIVELALPEIVKYLDD